MLAFLGVSYNMPGETTWAEKSDVYGLIPKLEQLLLRTHKDCDKVDAGTVLAFIRGNEKIERPEYAIIKQFIASTRHTIRIKNGQLRRGEKAVLLLYRFRLERNHRGIVPAFFWLLLQNPFTVRAMFDNRLRVR